MNRVNVERIGLPRYTVGAIPPGAFDLGVKIFEKLEIIKNYFSYKTVFVEFMFCFNLKVMP